MYRPSSSGVFLSTLIAFYGKSDATSGTGVSTRYWDCCKPSCAWPGKAAVNQPVLTCDAKDNTISDANTQSGCQSGTSFACSNNSPWAVNDNIAYGFAATAFSGGSEATCCACYKLTFTTGAAAGKTMVVQSTNTGSDVGSNQFDILMPGGGVGIYDGCTSQYGSALPGAQYGGVSSASECSSFPQSLVGGCDWRFGWFEGAENPSLTYEQVQCPVEIVAKSGCRRDDDGNFPAFNPGTVLSGASASATNAPASSTAVGTTTTAPSSTATGPSGSGSAGEWEQCGGSQWAGATTCASGLECVVVNEYYSQCQ